jgi:hypothetical protein
VNKSNLIFRGADIGKVRGETLTNSLVILEGNGVTVPVRRFLGPLDEFLCGNIAGDDYRTGGAGNEQQGEKTNIEKILR